jgi:hypothetical protein
MRLSRSVAHPRRGGYCTALEQRISMTCGGARLDRAKRANTVSRRLIERGRDD